MLSFLYHAQTVFQYTTVPVIRLEKSHQDRASGKPKTEIGYKTGLEYGGSGLR